MGESLKIPSEPAHTGKPEAQESAELFYLPNFATYSTLLGGHLKEEEYERVRKAAREPGAGVNKTLAINAQTYAGKAGISLSDKSLVLYSVLRKDEDISSELLHGDQQRLAEVLRMEGRGDDATKLEKAYSPVIKF